MDLAPLNTAHAHARNAAALSQGANLASAREEHEAAAQDFAKAKASVGDSEALRILDLLEHHHNQLASIIKSQSAPKETPSKDGESAKDTATPQTDHDKDPHVPKLVTRTSSSPVRTRRLHRETSSSIADNLARQRRGLPAAAELSNLQAGGRILSQLERPGYGGRQRSPESTRSLAPVAESRTLAPAVDIGTGKSGAGEEGFSKFYSTFGGLFEKLSGPLAFAGLPLSTEVSAPQHAPEQPAHTHTKTSKDKPKEKPPITRAASTDDPDLTALYSASTLKAIREDIGPSFGPQESFYLVPPTGGTVSYAGIVTHGAGTGSAGRVPDTIAEDDDEFVDAKESLSFGGPPSPRSLRGSAAVPAGGRRTRANSPVMARGKNKPGGAQALEGGKTPEELELEISVLKQLLDTQAKRLQMWEMSSQSQSMALQQSMRAVRQRPDLPSLPKDPSFPSQSTVDADAERIQQLEAQLKAEREERAEVEKRGERVEAENKRLATTVGRYRDKWEQLKAGARKREDDKRRRAGGGEGTKKEEGEDAGAGEEEGV